VTFARRKSAPTEVGELGVGDAVPVGVRIAGAWSWRILAIVGVIAVFIFLIMQLRLIVIPFMVAILLGALLVPLVQFLQRHRWPKWLAVALAELGLIAAVSGLVYLVVTQIIAEYPNLQERTVTAVSDFKGFLLASPLHLTEAQIDDYLAQAGAAIQKDSQALISGAVSVGSSFGHFFTGILLTLFATLFILIDGNGIWNWIVRLFPKKARPAMNGAGKAGWVTLTTFVKVQIFVAAVDAVGIGVGAFVLHVPLAIPLAITVFLGSFVPVVGAIVTGAIAAFVALVYNGPGIALIMVGIVLIVHQVEGHVLQPLVMGTAVRVHPLAVVFAVATGGFIAGIPGALFAVPVVAAFNVMVNYIAKGTWRTVPNPGPKDVIADA
jgi:predicted PurR-regulated permease PerM